MEEGEVPGHASTPAASENLEDSKGSVRVKRKTLQGRAGSVPEGVKSLVHTQELDEDNDDEDEDGVCSSSSLSLQSSVARRDDREAYEELTPNQLQEALSKTFSVKKKKKGKLRRAKDGSQVIFNVASWGATAIGIYQNLVLFNAAAKVFWTYCHVISKLLCSP